MLYLIVYDPSCPINMLVDVSGVVVFKGSTFARSFKSVVRDPHMVS